MLANYEGMDFQIASTRTKKGLVGQHNLAAEPFNLQLLLEREKSNPSRRF